MCYFEKTMLIDALIRIKNAQAVKKEIIKIPHSRVIVDVLEILVKNNYLNSISKKGRGLKKYIEVKLKYEDGDGVIEGIKLISKPSIKIYTGYKELPKVKSGYGLGIVSTSEGIMSYQEARKRQLGGELICELW